MKPPPEAQALPEAIARLEELLDLGPAQRRDRSVNEAADAVVNIRDHTFVIEWTTSGGAAPVVMAAAQVLKALEVLGERVIPIVAVPYMGSVGRERCEEAGVGWLDLSGNARISAPGIRLRVEGQPNRFKRRGRPSSAFAPKSSRIARWLLMHPQRSMTQREIAQATLMDEGFTSRIVAKLEDDELIIREPDGAIRVRDPNLLLDAWREKYDFSKHRIWRGHLAARSSDLLLRDLSERLHAERVQYAATGLSAAWLLTRFALFRVVTLYTMGQPPREVMELLGVREEDRGANVWVVAPNDEGVFHGASDHDGVHCVHPVQAYVDLLDHPERSQEAADELRNRLLTWEADA